MDGVNALYRLYPTADGWVFLAAPQPSEWEPLCRALRAATGGACDLAGDGRFGDAEQRRRGDKDLADLLAATLATRPATEWEATLIANDVACVEISQQSPSEFTIVNPAMTDNGFVTRVEHPVFGPHIRHGPMVTLSRTPGHGGPGSMPGQHTRKVLAELGYTDDEMTALRADKIINWPGADPS